MTEERLRALRYPNDVVDDVAQLVVPPPAHPHLRDGLDRQGGAPLRARRRRPARRAQPAAAVRLHDPQPEPGTGACTPDGRARARGSPSCASRRSSTPSGRRSTAGRSWSYLGVTPGRDRGRGARLPARGAPRRGPDQRGRRLRASRRVGPRAWPRSHGAVERRCGGGVERSERAARQGASVATQVPCGAASDRVIRRLPCARATRSSRDARTRRVGPGLEHGVDPEPGAPELGEHLTDAAGVDACRLTVASTSIGPGSKYDRSTAPEASMQSAIGWSYENTNGAVRLQHPLHLAEQPRRRRRPRRARRR